MGTASRAFSKFSTGFAKPVEELSSLGEVMVLGLNGRVRAIVRGRKKSKRNGAFAQINRRPIETSILGR